MTDTLQGHLVVNTAQRSDSAKFLYIAQSGMDNTAREDNLKR